MRYQVKCPTVSVQAGIRDTVSETLGIWANILKMSQRRAEELAHSDMLTWLRPLSSSTAAASCEAARLGKLRGPELMEELLRLVLAVHKARQGAEFLLVADGLIKDFSQLPTEQNWAEGIALRDQLKHIASFGRAFGTLLTQQWIAQNSDGSVGHVEPNSACTLRILLLASSLSAAWMPGGHVCFFCCKSYRTCRMALGQSC